MPGIARALSVLVAAGCLAAGCGSPPGPPVQPPSSRASARPPAASSTAPAADPQALILGAYTGMWDAYAVAARTADYQPGPLSRYAAGDALTVITRSLYNFHQSGIVARGAPVLRPLVTSMTPAANPDASAVTDCADDTHWLQYTTSGKPATGGAPAGRHRIYAQLRLFGSAWKVTYLVVEKAGTC